MGCEDSRIHWVRKATALAALTLTVLAGTLVAGALTANNADAAPNPYLGEDATHTVTIDSDGSYRVHIDQTMELARDYTFTFGGTVHDGFRLPDTESVLPPYLRAQYSDPAITMDGEPAEVEVEHLIHAVEISAEDRFSEGKHEGTVDYQVTGAAVRTEDTKTDAERVSVYVRPLVPGNVIVKSAAPILTVECEQWPPEGESCGGRSGQSWSIGRDEIEGAEVIRIVLDADEADILKPTIDSTK